jgi:hypothetical protein
MTRRIPLREVSHLRLSLSGGDDWIEQSTWIPVSSTEYHLASRHFPFAMRIENQRPELGLLLHSRYLARPPLDEAHRWRGAYRPIALRCFPFEIRELHDDPLSDLTIPADSPHLSHSTGIPFVEQDGRPSTAVAEMYRLLGILHRSREIFADALDQYLIAGLLVPIANHENREQPLYILDRNRFQQMDNAALSAMARHRLLGVDLAVAWSFSLQNLQASCLPKDSAAAPLRLSSKAGAIAEPVSILMDELALVLDDGELVSLGSLGDDTVGVGPAPAPKDVMPSSA